MGLPFIVVLIVVFGFLMWFGYLLDGEEGPWF